MALTQLIGTIQTDPIKMTTVLPIDELLRLGLNGLAFERVAAATKAFDHLEERVAQLAPARLNVQRNFYNPSLKDVRVKNLATGKMETKTVQSFVPSAKYKNATGDLLGYVKNHFIDAPANDTAAMPAFVLYFPEKLPWERASFNVGMGAEFGMADFTGVGKGMILDGESRFLAIERALSDPSVSGSRREILRQKNVTIEIYHGISPMEAGQIFADLNGKGVRLTTNQTAGRDIRDKWSKATREIFHELGVELETTGRQITGASRAQGRHLMFNQARIMVRALGLGTFSGATSSADLSDNVDFDRVVATGVEWFGKVLDHFDKYDDRAGVFTDPDLVLRSMPVKVALGLMGNAWYDTNLELRRQYEVAVTREINWRISKAWDGIAGKVTQLPDETWALASAGAKEVGTRAARALTGKPSKTKDYGKIRPGVPDLDAPTDSEVAADMSSEAAAV